MVGKIAGGDPSGTKYELKEEKKVAGGVLFFEIDPSKREIIKDITINYGGEEYYPSTILFADNNGSWRLQLKGANPSGQSSLSEFGRSDFVDHILIFEKIKTDYYILEVVEEAQLDELKHDSIFYAHNGMTTRSKLYGRIK